MNNDIGLNIKRYRKEKGLTQEELASKIGKSTITIRKYESGDILPSFYNVTKIAAVLGISSTDIIGEVEEYTGSDINREDKKEMINHPQHYNMGKFEAIDVIEDWKLNFNLGNAIKYISRAGHKDDIIQDLKKALWYLDREIKRLERGE